MFTFRWLNNNKLSWTVEDVNRAFSGLAGLEKFHLASNQIKSISKNAFIELHNIVTLDLSNNNITTLQNNSFSELTNLKVSMTIYYKITEDIYVLFVCFFIGALFEYEYACLRL